MEVDPLDKAMDLPGARRYARYVAAICPFHMDSRPSLLVYPDGFRCTACGARGSLSRLWQQASLRPLIPEAHKAEYRPSVSREMDNEQVARSAHKILLGNPGLQEYLIGRGLERAIREFQLGYWDGWYTIPVMDEAFKVNEIIFRAGPFIQGETGARFWQRSGQKPRMYVPDWKRLRPGRVLYVTFGLFDAVTLALMGYAAATSTIGKGSFKADWLLDWHDFIVILPDLEEEVEANRLAAQLDWRGRVLRLPYPAGCKDPNDFYRQDPEGLERIIHGFECRLRDSVGLGIATNRGRSAAVQSRRGGHPGAGAAI